MSTLIQRMQARYLHNHDFLAALGRENICVLSDFLDHQQVMNAFWSRFYSGDLPRQVICGLNPDLAACRTLGIEAKIRLGEGRFRRFCRAIVGSIAQKSGGICTVQADLQPISLKSDRLLVDEYLPGVPFSDFQRLARCMSEVERQDIEYSAPFFVNIIEAIGVESFFQRFYVTNVSAVGYFKEDGKLNYYDLPTDALEFVERCFVEEMEIVRPQRVIALGREVERTVTKLLPGIRVDSLPHPSWVMKQGGQEQQEWAEQYLSAMAVQ